MALSTSREVFHDKGGPTNNEQLLLRKTQQLIKEEKFEEGMSHLFFYLIIKIEEDGFNDLNPAYLSSLSSYLINMGENAGMLWSIIGEKEKLTEHELIRIKELKNMFNIAKWADKNLKTFRVYTLNKAYRKTELASLTDILENCEGGRLFEQLYTFKKCLRKAGIEEHLFIQVIRDTYKPLLHLKRKLERSVEQMIDLGKVAQVYQTLKVLAVIKDLCNSFEVLCHEEIWECSFSEAIQNNDILMTLRYTDFCLKEIGEIIKQMEDEEWETLRVNDEYPF